MPIFSVQVREVLMHYLFIEAPDTEAIYDWPYSDPTDTLATVCSTNDHAVTVEDRSIDVVSSVAAAPGGRPTYTISPLEYGL